MASRSLDDLHPRTRSKAVAALQNCKTDPWMAQHGIDVMVICTFRPDREQADLYGHGRTREQLDAVGLRTTTPMSGPIVTRALPGKSEHNKTDAFKKPAATAVDILVLRHGKPLWSTEGDGIDDNPDNDDTNDLEAWQRVAIHFKTSGFKWYGEPDAPFREFPHMSDPG